MEALIEAGAVTDAADKVKMRSIESPSCSFDQLDSFIISLY